MFETLSRLALVAMAPPGGGGTGGADGAGGLLGSPVFLILMIAVMFYFLLWKPENKKKQDREKMLSNLQKGDEVLTASGMYGKVTAVTDQNVTVEIAPGVRVKFNRQYISSVTSPDDDKSDKPKDKGENGSARK